METIAVYFTPLVATKVAAYVGLGIAYHMAVVYTNDAGQSFGVSSGPSYHVAAQTPQLALGAIFDSAREIPSRFGSLMSDPRNNHAFKKGTREDFYTQDYLGEPYPSVVVAKGEHLDKQWAAIVHSYERMGAVRLTYSPISQNSNSMAGTALRRAGLPIPFSSSVWFAPGVFNDLSGYLRLRGLAP